MNYSEIFVMLFIYTELMYFFIVPFRQEFNATAQGKSSKTGTQIFKENLRQLIVHRKALFALMMFVCTLLLIWFTTKAAENHFNAHSGYPPVYSTSKAMYSIWGIIIYTIMLYVLIALKRTIKVMKNEEA